MKSSSVITVREAIGEHIIENEVHVQLGAVGLFAANILQLTGSVEVIEQHAQLTEVTALTNLTGVWADLWDGTISDPLTDGAPGADLSGLPVGSWFTRDHDETQPYDVIDASACSQYAPAGPKLGDPFTVTQKTGGVDTFLRVRGNAVAAVDFKMLVKFRYRHIDGGNLRFV